MTIPDDFDNALQFGPAFEVKFIGDGIDAGRFQGYAATYGNVDHGGDTIAPGAFASSLAQHQSAGSRPALLWHHRGGEPVGRLLTMNEDARGLQVAGQLNLDTPAGQKAYAHVKAGDVRGLSIGYLVPPGGAERKAGGRLLKRLSLHEVSITPMAMDPHAQITGVKTLGSRGELERILIDAGLARRAALKLAAGGWPALVGGEDDPPQIDPSILTAGLAEKTAFAALASKIDTAMIELKSLEKGRR